MGDNKIITINNNAFYSLSNLTSLTLNSNLLTKLKPNMFTGLRNLDILQVNDNDIIDIQAGTFATMPQLTNLELSRNKLTHLGFNMFKGLENLRQLDLMFNNINEISAGTFEATSNLKSLYLSHNNLTNLRFNMLRGLPNLQTITLSNNRIKGIEAGTFNSTSKLEKLALDSNRLPSLRAGMFTGLGNLVELDLKSNVISDIQARTFLPTSQLKSLKLNRNRLTSLRTNMFTGSINLAILNLAFNNISDIQARTFLPTSQLSSLKLNRNRLTSLRTNMFTGSINLVILNLAFNNISDIQYETFTLTGLRSFTWLDLRSNNIKVLPMMSYRTLSSIRFVTIKDNPWQCDCRMLPFRTQMNGSHSFEDQIVCSQPSNLIGQKLKDIDPEDLICEPNIVRFEGNKQNNMSTLGENLVCEASGIPTPDITVTLPSGLNKTVQSVGRVTVGANSTVTINVTADVTGLYVCTATSPVGSTFAKLSVELRLDKPTHPTLEPDLHDSTNCTLELNLDRPTTVLSEPDKSTTFTLEPALAVFPDLTITGRSGKPESGSGEESGLSVSLTVLVGVICAINVAVLIGVIIVVMKWHKRRNNNVPSHPDPQNSTSVTASQDQTALAMSPAAIRSLIGNPMYDRGTAVAQHTHEDVDHIPPTGSADPKSNGCTIGTNNTNNASQGQATLSDSRVVIKSMTNPQYNSGTAVSEHTYEDVDNLSPTASTDPNSNGCTAANNTANVTASQDQCHHLYKETSPKTKNNTSYCYSQPR
ncbi:uncharacterized protein LOC144907189 [Branchiostoma floridae x Branchiostoma belcheri]